MNRPYISSPIIVAAETGDIKSLKKLLNDNPKVVNQTSSIGDALLHVSILQKQFATCSFLLENGADPNQKGNHGNTPLHCAAESGSARIVALLLEHGAKKNELNDRGQYAVDVATGFYEFGNRERAKVSKMLQGTNAISDLRNAIDRGKVKNAIKIIKSIDSIAALPEASELLFLAMLHEYVADGTEIIRVLLECGIDPDKPSIVGKERPISYASSGEAAELLLKHGANPNVANGLGDTPLKVAQRHKMKDVEAVLLKYGAKLKPQSSVNKRAKLPAAKRIPPKILSSKSNSTSNSNRLSKKTKSKS